MTSFLLQQKHLTEIWILMVGKNGLEEFLEYKCLDRNTSLFPNQSFWMPLSRCLSHEKRSINFFYCRRKFMCLDSILHAEHKSILEEMRVDYDLTQSMQNKSTTSEGLTSLVRKCVPNEKESDSIFDNPVGIISMEKYGEHKLEPDQVLPSNSALDLRYLLGSSSKSVKSNSCEESRIAVATSFQRAFMQLLCNAQFEELSARDLMLTSALNTDYLLNLPVYVDWKRAFSSNAIIFRANASDRLRMSLRIDQVRLSWLDKGPNIKTEVIYCSRVWYRRGYAMERQKGLLIVEKLDYLQSKLLQGIFFSISKPLGKFGLWLTEAFKCGSQVENAQVWANKIVMWLKELPLLQNSHDYDEHISESMIEVDHLLESDLPIWLAAQKAVKRYEGILSTAGPRSRLLRKLLTWIGLISPRPEKTFDLDSDICSSEPYLRLVLIDAPLPPFSAPRRSRRKRRKGLSSFYKLKATILDRPLSLSRISLGDIWEPATRKSCGNDLWKMLKTAISILLSQSILQEPAFQELILLYTEERGEEAAEDREDRAVVPSLQLKIYEKIPIPDLPVIFPHKKLSFRILDTVRLDVSTILGLLAYFINYKFEDILSSP
ncbi:unnamed protein product [Ilex paraguariensis]|uniref:Uncharacterized protein n=1 Tax=Ilex paraguariensis TaxID=185542 RepID=A0ABC8RB43_9AQUA